MSCFAQGRHDGPGSPAADECRSLVAAPVGEEPVAQEPVDGTEGPATGVGPQQAARPAPAPTAPAGDGGGNGNGSHGNGTR